MTQDSNLIVNYVFLFNRAKELAQELDINNFRASSSWLSGFKERNKLSTRKVCGESNKVSIEEINDWMNKNKSLIEQYSPCDIFNADESCEFNSKKIVNNYRNFQ